MDFIIVLAALGFLMLAAYRGYSVILMAPVAALGAVLLTSPSSVAPMFSDTFMGAMVNFVKNYFPVFLLGAVFGKLIELSGFSKSIVAAVIKWIGADRAILVIVIVCALLTYGGVSLFVVVFAVYPFASELFRQNSIPKHLIPGVVALGAFSFTMDALPGTPQIQNIIPTTFFGTTTWAAPILGVVGTLFVLVVGISYLNWRRISCVAKGEGYATGPLVNEPEPVDTADLPNPILSITPLFLIGIVNFVLTRMIPVWYGESHTVSMPGMKAPLVTKISSVVGIWAVEGALLTGIIFIVIFAWKTISKKIADGSKQAVAGAMLAGLNTASEYGFGAVIATLAGFSVVKDMLAGIPNPLVNAAVSVSTLAGVTGSASGGMSIALAALGEQFIAACNAAGIPMEVLHRVVAMASGGMDTLPHNGAVITVLAVTGLTHKESYKDIFAVTVIKTLAVFFVIGFYYTTGLV
ncbi:GntP family permease [Microvirga sp. W0021]|uniref:GntP family permease n=1 Tax=Hohaiivirga grylli TaxID=3133970 RepID=A0ABV0BML4_9HYPH